MAGAQIDPKDPCIIYAKTFATESGRGADVDAAYAIVEKHIGTSKAASVQALCWALQWGKTTGNSINAAKSKVVTCNLGSLTSLDVFLLAYYGPLFLVIAVLNAILRMAPQIPPTASTALGAILWMPQAVNILPLGVVSIVLSFGIV